MSSYHIMMRRQHHYTTRTNVIKNMQDFVPACAYWLQSFFRSLFRKSVLVGQHTVYWLRASTLSLSRSSSSTQQKMLLHKNGDEIARFESPIHRRFKSLYSCEEAEAETITPPNPPTSTHRTYLDWWIYVPMSYLYATTLFPVSLFGWALAHHVLHVKNKEEEETVAASNQQHKPKPRLCTDEKYNANVDPLFYDRVELKRALMRPKNELERAWLSRKLYVTTPRGNILMHYDAFKEGFAYYGDQTGIPYRILNAVAMKYVMMYRCLDFFVDEGVLSGNPSPLIELLFEEETCEQNKKKHTMKHLLSSGKEGDERNPFVKSKSPMESTFGTHVAQAYLPGTKTRSMVPPPPPLVVAPLRKNKFLYMGKLQNASWLQSMAKPIYYSVSASSVYEQVLSEANVVQRELMSYKIYKQQNTSTSRG